MLNRLEGWKWFRIHTAESSWSINPVPAYDWHRLEQEVSSISSDLLNSVHIVILTLH